MPIPVQRDALKHVLTACRDHCACIGPSAQLLDLLPALLHADRTHEAASVLAAEWGQAMAILMPSEEQLLWLGGVWLGTAQRTLGADSEAAEALGHLFAAAAERALWSARPLDTGSGPAGAGHDHSRPAT